MEIKMSLKQLMAAYGQSANDASLDPGVRRFAAQNMVMVAHLRRVEAKLESEVATRVAMAKELKDVLAELVALVQGGQPAATTTPDAAPGAPPPATDSGGEDEDPEVKAMIEKLQQDTEADKVATLGRPADVTPLRAAPSAPTAVAKPNKPSTGGAA